MLKEGLAVAAVGAALAFAANAISPRGLSLGQDYFPKATTVSPTTMRTNSASSNPIATNSTQPAATDPSAERLKAEGVQVVDGARAAELFRDPRRESDAIIFVDARDDEHYQAGHIPGAYQFDHYHPANYLPTILPACQAAQTIVVYCNGGECEDSEFAALTLRDRLGISGEKIFVFTGGIKEWEASRLPVETGARKSGQLRAASQ